MRRWAPAVVFVSMAVIVGPAAPLIAQVSQPSIERSSAEAVRRRVDLGATLAKEAFTAWLGPAPAGRVSIGDPMTATIGRWDDNGTMQIESRIVDDIARQWLARVRGNDSWKNGAIIYLQSRVIEQLFERAFFIKGYRYDGACFFGCSVPWSFRSLPLSRWTAVSSADARVFASLERELGWPTLQGALRAAASGANPDPIAAMSDATGRDLAPVFAAAASGVVNDHAVAGFMGSDARTHVSITRNGPVPFPLVLRVEFADGRHLDLAWQGRDRVAIESAARAVAVRLDPDRVWLLDRNPLNNTRVEPRPTNVPIWKWAARWITWLQDAMLTQTFPV